MEKVGEKFWFPSLFFESVENEWLDPHIFGHVVGKHIGMDYRRNFGCPRDLSNILLWILGFEYK
jgi:hypothetical protein